MKNNGHTNPDTLVDRYLSEQASEEDLAALERELK
jgi:hypothetical protein